MIKKNTTQVMVGNIAVGGGAPVVIQSMTNTDTSDKRETVSQILDLWKTSFTKLNFTMFSPNSSQRCTASAQASRT